MTDPALDTLIRHVEADIRGAETLMMRLPARESQETWNRLDLAREWLSNALSELYRVRDEY